MVPYDHAEGKNWEAVRRPKRALRCMISWRVTRYVIMEERYKQKNRINK
jgi:hypothetical protein